MNISKWMCRILNSIHSSHSELTPIVQVLCQLSSLTIAYADLGFNLSFLTFMFPMYDSFRPLSHHTILCRLHSSPFLKQWILLEICLVCLMLLPLLAIHTYDLLSNIIRGSCYGTTSGYLFNNSLFGILKCDRSINAVHDSLYSLSALYWATGPRTCV